MAEASPERMRDDLLAKHGPFCIAPCDEPDVVLIRHPSRESAEAFGALDSGRSRSVIERDGAFFARYDLAIAREEAGISG